MKYSYHPWATQSAGDVETGTREYPLYHWATQSDSSVETGKYSFVRNKMDRSSSVDVTSLRATSHEKINASRSLSLDNRYYPHSDGEFIRRGRRRGSRGYGLAPNSTAFGRRPVLRSKSCHSVLSVTVKLAPKKDADISEEEAPTSLWHSTKRQKLILICLAVGEFMAFGSFSLLAPFFPQEATDRSISSTTSGWVFGVFSLVQFLVSPVLGKLIPKVGSKFLLMAGAFVTGCCTVMFGFLDELPNDPYNNKLFVIFCFIVRIVMALGATAWSTASFAIATSTFSENPATVMGLMETAVGMGLMSGPAIGGVLYQYGGFKLPFIVVGVLVLAVLPIMFFALEKDRQLMGESDPGSVLELLRVPAISIVAVVIFGAAVLWTFLDPTLEPHLRPFDLSTTEVGLVFLLLSACYAILAPIVGLVADKIDDSTPMMILGFLIISVSYFLLGPSPLTGLGSYLWLNLVSLAFLGLGMALAIVPTFDKILWSAEKSGIEDSLGMHGAVAGLVNSVYALGETVGPGMSGFLVETFDFPWTMTVCSGLALVVVLLLSILWFLENCTSILNYKYPDGEISETTPLIPKEEDYKFVTYDCGD